MAAGVATLVAGVGRVSVSAEQVPAVQAQQRESLIGAPDRRQGEGLGPFKTLAIRGVMLIDGSGAPPQGPMDIIVSGNRITAVRAAGTPGLPLRPNRPPQADHEIDATGMYLMPGFVDMHVHAGGSPKNEEAEYAYKLWMAHGVTTVRGVGLGPQDFSAREKDRSAKNEIVAPRIFNYQRPGSGWSEGDIDSPDKARRWVQWAAANNVDGLKLGAMEPTLMTAVLDEAKKHGLGSTAHLQQSGVAHMNAIKAARLGLGTVTHFYGHFESLLKDYVVQPWPVDMNAADEQWRFGQVARLWDKIHEPGSPEWKAYLQEHLKLGTVFDPTFNIYSAGRHVMAFRNAEWHDKYTLPSLMDFYTPSRAAHGSYWFYWTTEDEIAWRNFYQVWFKLVNDYKKLGGRIVAGSDSGFIYQTYGFGYVTELEMLQEAGLHPLEVIQAATMNGALTLMEPKGQTPEFGVVSAGMLADMVIVDQNPLQNLKVLYGNGAVKLNDETREVERVGGVKYTIKDGIVYDAKQLLADVAAMVEKQKRERAAKTTTAR
ncbi:MAG: amidohydrolase family protein [Acidobacteria bacterium]|nr:amidohydrolase family protein [Acidobacteriota bacterium]MBA3885663.1 amidohydrolase family protein [Acidobacteriota bacterium]